jgi:hypothetical protein
MANIVQRERGTYTGADAAFRDKPDKTVTVIGRVANRKGYVRVRDVYGHVHEVRGRDVKRTGNETNGPSFEFETE